MLAALSFVGPFAFTLLWLSWFLVPVPWYITLVGCVTIGVNQCLMLFLMPAVGRTR